MIKTHNGQSVDVKVKIEPLKLKFDYMSDSVRQDMKLVSKKINEIIEAINDWEEGDSPGTTIINR